MEDVKSLEISTSNRKILILDIELCIFQNILEMQLPKKIILSTFLPSTRSNLCLQSEYRKFILYTLPLFLITYSIKTTLEPSKP